MGGNRETEGQKLDASRERIEDREELEEVARVRAARGGEGQWAMGMGHGPSGLWRLETRDCGRHGRGVSLVDTQGTASMAHKGTITRY